SNSYGMVTSAVATLTVRSALDHFTWSAINSPQLMGVPFPVTISAWDLFNGIDTNFSGVVNLTATGTDGLATNQMFAAISPSASVTGTYTWGFPFIPAANITATHVRHS